MATPNARFRLSTPPPDVVAPVAIAAAANGKRWQLSAPPSDEIADVNLAQGLASQSQWRFSNAPEDEVAPVQIVQAMREPGYPGELAEWEDPPDEAVTSPASTTLDIPALLAIVREVGASHSGADSYSAIVTDPPERGLAFGLLLFTQASGHLGSVLRLMRERDPHGFAQVFAPRADDLLEVTTAASETARLRPVGGEPLTSPAWTTRFRTAGSLPVCQAAQNEEAVEGVLRPLMSLAVALGLDTDRAIAMALDSVIDAGLAGGFAWITRVAGPLRTARQRQYALQLLGYEGVAAFQTSVGMTPNGRFTPATHALLVSALRTQGLMPMPSATDLIARLHAAASETVRTRLLRLQTSTVFSDIRVG